MRKLIHVLIALVVLSSSAFAGERECIDCQLYKYGEHRLVIPAKDTVCVWFVQPQKGNVLLRLVFGDGTASRAYTKANADVHDCIIVGREWLKRAGPLSYICNYLAHFNYAQRGMIETLASKPKFSHAVEACLYGKAKCHKMGYPAYM